MIRIHLRKVLSNFEERTGERLTYTELAKRTGISKATIDSLATRDDYNPTLKTIDRICTTLKCDLHVLLEFKLEEQE